MKDFENKDLDEILREVLTSEKHFFQSTSAGQAQTQRNSKIREIIERRAKRLQADDT